MSVILVKPEDPYARPSVLFERCPLVVLYVSTDLRTLMMGGAEAQNYARDLRQRDSDRWRIYRRLDLNYWVWLIGRMPAAEQAYAAGRISAETLNAARDVVALCQSWIEQIYTKQQIAAATTSAATYQPPAKIAA